VARVKPIVTWGLIGLTESLAMGETELARKQIQTSLGFVNRS